MRAGLCDECRHQRVVTSARGSTFSLCQRAASDPRLERYPRLPVLRCPGLEPRAAGADGAAAGGGAAGLDEGAAKG